MDTVLVAAEELYLLNQRFTLARVQRVYEMYRRYVNPHVTDGGYALTLDEVLFVLEIPLDDDEVEVRAFFERMMERSTTEARDAMDMLEFLVAFTLLSRGTLLAKAHFLFALFDFDVEDEIDQEELSLLMTLATSGLHKLGLVEELPTFDAITQMSADGFARHGVAAGAKMNFNQFLDWATFHADPQSLLQRFTCALRLHHLVHGLSRLAHRQVDPYYRYQLALQTPSPPLDAVRVLCGPIVGQVSDTTIDVLYEFSTAATVTFYAFEDKDVVDPHCPPTDTASRRLRLAESHVLTVAEHEPVLVAFTALTPGATYLIGLTGVATGDANTRTARVATQPPTVTTLRITVLNHLGPTLLPSHDALSMATASELSAATKSPRLMLHWHFGTFSPEMILHALDLLDLQNLASVQSTTDAIQCHCRQVWAPLDDVASTASNLVLTGWKDALYGGFDDSHMSQLKTLPQASRTWLETCVQAMWTRYVAALYPPTTESSNDELALYRRGPIALIYVPPTLASTDTLQHLLRATTSSVCVVLTTSPLFPLEEAPQHPASTSRHLGALSSWLLQDPSRRLVLLAPTHGAGATSTVHVKGTSYSFQQLLCGALRQRRPLGQLMDGYSAYDVDKFTVEHALPHWETHFGQLDVQVDATVDVAAHCIATARWAASPRIVVGPVVGLVTARSAQLLIELDADAVVLGEAIDIVTQARYVCRGRLYRAEPAVLTFDHLQPQRRYRGLRCASPIYVQTPHERAPSLHVTWVGGDDAFENRAFQPVDSFWPDYRESMTLWPTTDITVLLHRTSLSLASICAAMAHWRGAPTTAESVVKQLFRATFVTQWNAQDNAAVLAHGSHCFLGTGYDWSAVNEPISRDVVVWARQVAFAYQRHGIWPTLDPLRRYGYHCQDGIGFLHLDVLEHCLANADIYLQNTPEFLSPSQWQLVECVLTQVAGLCCTVISCSSPIVWHQHRHEVPSSRYLGLEWVLYPTEQQRLLTLAFAWKAAVPGRDLIFVCAGPRSATTTLVHAGVSVTQVVVGPVACVVEDLPTLPNTTGTLCDGTVAFTHVFGASPEYASTILTPHATQARWRLHRHQLAQPNAKILVGPVLGKLTPTSIRILIEVDRDVEACVCVCTTPLATDRITATCALRAYTPLAFSLVELTPATEYIVTFEGIAPASVVTRFTTPATTPYAFSMLAVHDTNWQTVLTRSAASSAMLSTSSWADILRSRSINATEAAATAHTNGDILGVDGANNLWQRADVDHTSAPLRKPIVLVHNGGHVNLRAAFSDAELATIVMRLVAMDEAHWASVLPELQHAMQEAYRVQWNIPPFRDALRNCSNVMLFDEMDLYFRLSVIEGRLDETLDAAKAARVLQLLRDTAYNVWLLYANQLATDVNPPESLTATRTSMFASYGQCTLVVLNQHATPKEATAAAPVPKSSGIDLSKVTQANNLLPPGAWLTLDDALLYAKQGCKVLLVVLAFDALEVALNPLYLVGVNRLFEKLFEWKNQAPGADRELHLVTLGPALTTYLVTDQRSQGVCGLQQLASISTPTRASSTPLYPPSGAITKRFLYAKQGNDAADATQSFVSFAYFSDLDRVQCHMQPVVEPYNIPCKALLGPVLGRLRVVQDRETDKYSVTATLLLEVNAARAITCIVLDILSGDEQRVTQELQAYTPSVFLLATLDVDRRYTYRFEGLDDETRCGTFHTPSEHTSVLNMVAVSSNLIQFRDPAVVNSWDLLLQRLRVPWHGLDVLLHVGGQVPLQEAAAECTHWLQDECDRRPMDTLAQVVATLRPRLRRRFQQEYWAAWNVPHFRHVLACISNWMVRGQADVATTYGRSPDLLLKEDMSLRTLEILSYIHEIAMDVWRAYQGALGWGPDASDADEPQGSIAESHVTTPGLPLYYALRLEHIGVFVFDLRSTRVGDVISCNGRLSTPLPPTARPTISEAQWLAFETLLRKKSVRALILVMEFPLLLTTPKSAPLTAARPLLYNALDLQAHWVACPSQLDQLLSLLFKWKEKIDGRDVAVLSGNMGFGLETTIKDKTSTFELHNYTTGPITSTVQPFPFTDRGTFEKRFEFEQRFVSPLPNYVLLEVAIESHVVDAAVTLTYASLIGDVLDSANARVLHAPTRLRRRPPWWRRYCLQDERAFWTTIVVNSVESQSILATYLADDKAYLNATKRWYTKYNFVDTTRLADLQSSSTSPETLLASLHDVAKDMWATFPPAIKATVAVLSDVFVVDLALEQLQLDLSGPIDVERFRAICTGLAKGACALKAAATLAAEDAAIAYEADRLAKLEQQRTSAAATEKAAADAVADAVAMAALQKANLLEYAQEMNKREKDRLEKEAADKATAKAAKRAAREAEKLHHHDDDVALHKEKKALAALKGRLETHYASLGQTPEFEAMEIECGRRTREVHLLQQRRDESKARDAKTKTKPTAETKGST